MSVAMTESVAGPVLGVVSTDGRLVALVRALASELDVAVDSEPASGPLLVDPFVGPEEIRARLAGMGEPPLAAIIRRPSCAGGIFFALRAARARLLDDPRVDPRGLRAFLADAFAIRPDSVDRRGYPRARPSGVEVVSPEGAELVDVSPYGARLRLAGDWTERPILRMRLRIGHDGPVEDVDCQVIHAVRDEEATDLRVRFARVTAEAQQQIFKIAKAGILCETIEDTLARCERQEVDGYRQVRTHPEVMAILKGLAEDGAQITFAQVHGGRAVMGAACGIDETRRHLHVRTRAAAALGPPGTYLRYATAIRHQSYMMDGYLLAGDGDGIAVSFPLRCVSTDQRSQARMHLGLDSPVTVRLDGEAFPVTDLSPNGFSFYVPEAGGAVPERGHLDALFDLAPGLTHRETVLVRHRRREPSGWTVGATFLGHLPVEREGMGTRATIHEQQFDASGVRPRPAPLPYRAELVRFAAGNREIAGLWSEVRHPGPATVVVVPPAFAKTKESSSLLAQFLAACFDASGRHLGVLRFDFSNSLGESHKDPPFRMPGMETLGLKLSDLVEDIRAALAHAHERVGSPVACTALVGMSFSGPLCLRVAVEDRRVTHLAELMGASDIQDLIRTASGGIDYVANYRAGLRTPQQNILGVLSDPNCWCPDGIASRLLFLQDAQADASRLRVPLLWIHGRHDAFVDEARIRGILESAPVSKHLVIVPCGHVPTKSLEALAAYLPIARFLLGAVGTAEPVVAIPTEDQARTVAGEEWARAPKTPLASPRDYWREYMLGGTEGIPGFDILSMTRQYRELMRLQVAMLAPVRGETVHDVGGGLGHALHYLAESEAGPDLAVHVYDIVPQLLDEVRRRHGHLGERLRTIAWDADREEVPEALLGARTLLMSLFLSCLADAGACLARLAARLPPGARVVASSMKPDADLSSAYTELLADIRSGAIPAPAGHTQEEFLQAARSYMNSAAWLLRLAEEGTFHFFSRGELTSLFEQAGFAVRQVRESFGPPYQAVVLEAERIDGGK